MFAPPNRFLSECPHERIAIRRRRCILIPAGLSLGDEILFNNGDRLTGTIVQSVDGKMTIKTTVAGEITVDMKEVKTFTTDAPVDVKLSDGTVLKAQTIAPTTRPGAIQTQGGAVAAQNVELANVAAINPPPAKWTGAVVVGGMIARGNSKTESLSVAADAVRRGEEDRFTLGAGYLFSREQSPATGVTSTTADNWFAAGKFDHFFTEKFYGFASMRIEKDRIADLDLRLVPSGGVGYQWVETPKLNFNTEAGLAWVYESYTTGGTDEHIAARLAYHVDWAVNDRVKLFHDLEYLPSLESLSDFNLNTQVGIRADLTESMFAEFKFQDRYDATPAPGATKTDLRYILGAGWRF